MTEKSPDVISFRRGLLFIMTLEINGHGEQGKCGQHICLTFQPESFLSKRKREVMNKKQNGLVDVKKRGLSLYGYRKYDQCFTSGNKNQSPWSYTIHSNYF